LAFALLLRGNIKTLKGANHENATCHHVQESSGATNQTTRDDLQALRRADLLYELFESAS
jgi:hypothetical protein